MNIQKIFGQASTQKSSKPLIAKGFYLLRMSDYYCFHRVVKEQLTQCNSRNTATVLRVVVKSHNGLKGTKVFARGCSGRNLNNLSKFAGKSRCYGTFYRKVAACNSLQKITRSTLSKKKNAYTETLSQARPVNFEKKYEHG